MAFNSFLMRHFVLSHVAHKQVFTKVVGHGCACEVLSSRDEFALCKSLFTHEFMHQSTLGPGVTPIRPMLNGMGHVFEITCIDAIDGIARQHVFSCVCYMVICHLNLY